MTDAINPTQDIGINQADYLKLFMQELTYQDPLKPIDNREFMTQMAQFSALQEMEATNKSLELLTSLTSGNQSLMLLGKSVKIKGSEQEGIVNKISFPYQAPPQVHVLMNGGELKEIQVSEITTVWNSSRS